MKIKLHLTGGVGVGVGALDRTVGLDVGGFVALQDPTRIQLDDVVIIGGPLQPFSEHSYTFLFNPPEGEYETSSLGLYLLLDEYSGGQDANKRVVGLDVGLVVGDVVVDVVVVVVVVNT